MRGLSERSPDVEPRLTRGRLWLLALASLLAPSVMMIQYLRDLGGDLPVLIGASAALFLLVVIRIAGLVRKQEQSTVRERALRGAGTALVTATNREGIYAATLQAAGSIAGEGSVIRILASEGERDAFTVVAAAGGDEESSATRSPSRSCRSGSGTGSENASFLRGAAPRGRARGPAGVPRGVHHAC